MRPQQGANIPLAYQHLYRNINILLASGIIDNFTYLEDLLPGSDLLNEVAVQQLLMYHVDTRTAGGAYNMHQERVDFLSGLNILGNFPKHCKITAVSGGSAEGKNQLRSWDGNFRTPGDRLANFNAEGFGRILWIKFLKAKATLNLNTSSGSNIIYESEFSYWRMKIKFTWRGGLKLKTISIISPKQTIAANINSYDVAAGSYTERLAFSIPEFDFRFRSFPMVNLSASLQNLGGGEYKFSGKGGLFLGIIGAGKAKATLKTDGFGFNFIPLRSSLSYGGNIYIGNPSPAIENLPASVVVANTPYDVIVGISSENGTEDNFYTYLEYNYSHEKLPNPKLMDNNVPIPMRTCDDNLSYLINRDIGEETLYLENWDMPFEKLNLFPEYDLLINERNPAYRYPNYFLQSKQNLGAFSKENPFLQYNSTDTKFFSDQTAAINIYGTPGYIYNAPVTGINTVYSDEPLYICCGPSARKKYGKSVAENSDIEMGVDNHYYWTGLQIIATK